MAISKVIYGGETLIDLTSDTVTKDTLLVGAKAHGSNGEVIEGDCDWDCNTQDATATATEILVGKTAYNKAVKVTGTMKNNASVSGTISSKDGVYTVPQGFHDGGGKVQIASAEKQKLIATNIREGVTILGVEGSMSGTEGAKPQKRTVTPSTAVQNILPEEGYNYLSEVVVSAVPYEESQNSAGGITVTIC